jgi:hypothetical protein
MKLAAAKVISKMVFSQLGYDSEDFGSVTSQTEESLESAETLFSSMISGVSVDTADISGPKCGECRVGSSSSIEESMASLADRRRTLATGEEEGQARR